MAALEPSPSFCPPSRRAEASNAGAGPRGSAAATSGVIRSAGNAEKQLRLHVLPAWGKRPVTAIERGDLVRLIEAVRVPRTIEVREGGRVLQRTRGATEAMYLLARYVFEDLGYRRYEWKCHALNERSRSAALRLGFTFEGIFRQHMIIKGRNRDTAWYSMLDSEWPARKARLERWLAPENFDADGRQRTPLSDARAEPL